MAHSEFYNWTYREYLSKIKDIVSSKNELVFWGLQKKYRSLARDLDSPLSTGDGYEAIQKVFKDHGIDPKLDGSELKYDINVDYIHIYVDVCRMLDYLTKVVGKYGDHKAIADVRDASVRLIGIKLGLNTDEVFNRYPDITPKLK